MAEDRYPYLKIPEEYYYEFYSEGQKAGDTGSVAKYANAPFFKKKDEEAVKFLKKHPVPAEF